MPSAPVEAGGQLYEVGPDGISAYNQWSGARLWNAPPPAYGGNEHFQLVTGMQVIGNELLVAATDCISETNSHAHVVLLSTATGRLLVPEWYTDGGSVGGTTAADGVIVADETNNTELFVVATDMSGHDLWTRDSWSFGGVVSANLGLAYLRSDTGVLTAVHLADGTVAWSAPSVVNPQGLALSQDGKDLYVSTAAGGLMSVNPQTGAKRMSARVGRGGSLAVTSTTVFSTCSSASTLCATRRSDGKKLWSVTTLGQCQPIVADAVVYCAGRTYKAATGARIVSKVLDGITVDSVSGGRVYALVGTPLKIESFK